jgi:hypothetical protein
MDTSPSDSFLYYEAGQAVAAAHLGLTIRLVSANPALHATDIMLPRNNPKSRLILWLTGMAAEKRALGKSSPLRRTRNRQRVRAQVDALMEELAGSTARRRAVARKLLNQSQDRANSIVASLFDAVEILAAQLRNKPSLSGQEVVDVVLQIKARRRRESQ